MHILHSAYLISSPEYSMCPAPDRPEYAFIGRSNVGKSSLINMLVNKKELAKISGTPGKTQLINHFEIENAGKEGSAQNHKWYIVDLPGYGFAKVSIAQRSKWEKMIRNYLLKRKNLVNVFVLIDSRHGPQKIDLDFVNQLGDWKIPFCLVFTKADKETQKIVSQHVKAFLLKMRERWQFLPQHFVTSTIKKAGRDKILQCIESMNADFENGLVEQ